MLDFKYENNLKNINDYHPRAHLSLFITVHQSLILRNEEKLVALLVYSSFVRVATSGFRIIPYSLVVVVVCARMRSESGITLCSPQHGIVRIVLVTSPD